MQISFTQTPEAYLAFCQYNSWTDPAKKQYRLKQRLLWGVYSLMPYAFLLLFSNTLKINSYAGTVLFGILIFMSGFLAVQSLTMARCKSYVRYITKDPLNHKLFGPVSLRFETERIYWKTNDSEGSCSYETIQKRIETEAYFFLMVSSHNAWIIPKTAFDGNEQREEFIRLFHL